MEYSHLRQTAFGDLHNSLRRGLIFWRRKKGGETLIGFYEIASNRIKSALIEYLSLQDEEMIKFKTTARKLSNSFNLFIGPLGVFSRLFPSCVTISRSKNLLLLVPCAFNYCFFHVPNSVGVAGISGCRPSMFRGIPKIDRARNPLYLALSVLCSPELEMSVRSDVRERTAMFSGKECRFWNQQDHPKKSLLSYIGVSHTLGHLHDPQKTEVAVQLSVPRLLTIQLSIPLNDFHS